MRQPKTSSPTRGGSSTIGTICPSTRIRTWQVSPLGSMWMSVARDLLANCINRRIALAPSLVPARACEGLPLASISATNSGSDNFGGSASMVDSMCCFHSLVSSCGSGIDSVKLVEGLLANPLAFGRLAHIGR